MKGCPLYLTELLTEKGLIKNGEYQIVDGVTLYLSDYFNPYDSITGRLNKTENTYSIHWYDQSWGNDSKFKKRLTQLIHRVFGKNSLSWLKKVLGK